MVRRGMACGVILNFESVLNTEDGGEAIAGEFPVLREVYVIAWVPERVNRWDLGAFSALYDTSEWTLYKIDDCGDGHIWHDVAENDPKVQIALGEVPLAAVSEGRRA